MSKNNYYPVLGSEIQNSEYGLIDLSSNNPELVPFEVDTPAGMQSYIDHLKKQKNIMVPYGGYGEKRFIYMKSPLFKNSGRCIHLGVDLWMPSQTPIYAGENAIVHSVANNDNFLDYGATIILQYESVDESFFVLYGHLSLSSISKLEKGMKLAKGEQFAWIGAYEENGNWAPHLHIQCILDIGGFEGDYPGVASKKEAKTFLKNCPDPERLLFS